MYRVKDCVCVCVYVCVCVCVRERERERERGRGRERERERERGKRILWGEGVTCRSFYPLSHITQAQKKTARGTWSVSTL